MMFEKEHLPQFREADRDGYVGLRGYMNYFQDMATHYMHNIHKGNDTLPEEYGVVWMFTKYRMHIKRKADFTGELHMETWIQEEKSSAVVHQGLLITKDEEVYAKGCVESCLYNVSEKRLVRLREVDFPTDIQVKRDAIAGKFRKIPVEREGMEYSYFHKVRYTDLDKTGHMTNLKYIDLFLNSFDSAFFEKYYITDFELHFLSQCFEGETIHVYKEIEDERIRLLAVHENGKPCAAAFLERRKGND